MLLKSGDIAYLGVLLGLNQMFIIISSVIKTNTIIIFAAAALIIGIVIVEFGVKSGIVFYIASCILGFLLTFNKIEIIVYILFFGLYSIIKYILEKNIKKKIALYAYKIIYFNIALVTMYFIVKLFIVLELTWWMILIAQVLFIIYDYAFTIFISSYKDNIKPKLKKR